MITFFLIQLGFADTEISKIYSYIILPYFLNYAQFLYHEGGLYN